MKASSVECEIVSARHIAAAFALISVGQPALAEPNPLSPQDQRLVEDVVLCYRSAVIKNAVQSCFHEEATVAEAYTLCGPLETKLKEKIQITVKNPSFPQQIVDGVREEIRGKLHDIFIVSRAQSGMVCP